MSAQIRPYDLVKRVLDMFTALFLLIISLPVLVTVAAIVAVNLGRPVLFRQMRPGKNGRVFTLLKFRSMRDVNEAHGLVTDEQRLTPFGRKLRSTSLDELPSLLNVLKGDMSMVGPRPLLVEYLPLYSPEQSRRHEVRPGVTGLAQVMGRNQLSWNQKFELDVRYVEKRSLRTDLRIVGRTFSAVLRRTGINNEDHATMPRFER